MKKLLWVLGIAIVLYLISAVAAWQMLPTKLADAERRGADVRLAIARLTHDQWLVSERVRVITDETLGRGKTKLDEVSALLGDPDLNHLALAYLGSDWSVQRSAFLGQISHARNLIDTQIKLRNKNKSRLNEKIRELEVRKNAVIKKIGSKPDDRALRVELNDIDLQLQGLRSSYTIKEYTEKDNVDKQNIEVTARNEDRLFKLASDCQQATVGALNAHLAQQLSELKWEANEPQRLRRTASWFNIWPLNLIMKMPEDERP